MRNSACRGVGSSRPRSGAPRHTQLLESLESRLLLSVSYANGDFGGTWDLIGCQTGGTLTANGAGGLTGGSVRTGDDIMRVVTTGSYTIDATGEISGAVTVAAEVHNFWGSMATTKDLILVYASDFEDSPVLIKHSPGNFANADAAGMWSFTSFTVGGDTAHGTMILDSAGHVTSLSGTSSEGGSFRITGATYSLTADGEITVNAPSGDGTLTFAGAMNDGKDFVGMDATSFDLAITSENPAAIYMEKTSGRTFSNADLSGTYFMTDVLTYDWADEGTICFDGAGHIVPGPSDFFGGIAGTYSVSATGQVTIKATVDYYGDPEVHTLYGALNTSNSLLTLSGKVTYPGKSWSPDYDIWMIVPDNRAPTLGSFVPLGPAVAGQPYTITYDELLAHSDARDGDGDDVVFRLAALGNGSASIAPAHGADTLRPGDTLTWTPSASASGTSNLYFIATDGADRAYAAVPLKIATLAKPAVSLAATKNTAGETHTATSDLGVFTFTRTGGDLAAPLTVNFAIDGTATNGTDYDAIATSITFAANEKSKTLTITPVNDALGEGAETVRLALEVSDDYTLGSKNTATANIVDDEPLVSVVATKSVIGEAKPAAAGVFTFTRSGGNLAQPLTISFTLTGAATADEDFTGFPSSITFFANEKTKTLNVTAIDDSAADAGESLTLTLVPEPPLASAYAIAAAKSAGTITILDNEPLVSVTTGKAGTSEASPDKPAVFTFTRLGGDMTQEMLVHYSVSGSALSGPDFNPLPGQVIIPPNEKSATVSLTPLDDGKGDAGHNVVLTVIPDDDVSPTYSADLAKGSCRCVIADNEPLVSIVANKNKAAELGGKGGQFTITRSGPNLGPSLEVHFLITGTAATGLDYSAIGNTVTFAPFEKSKTIDVVPADDSIAEGSETVVLTLVPDSDVLPTYSIVTGKVAATVSIADHNRPLEFGSPDYYDGDTFTFDDIKWALNVSDPEGAPITFVVAKVADGVFTKNGVLVTTGTTIVDGDVLVWYPKSYLTTANVKAMSLTATDGVNTSPVKTLELNLWG